tara:strand:- start:515 stop:1261 length:747 start_codon:yes stop_codon:yes gene_type:complete
MRNKPIIAANWKMNKTPNEGIEFFDEIKSNFSGDQDIIIIIGIAFTGLNSFSPVPPIFKAAQNCHWEQSGAYTGEISVDMIKDCGADYVILGHSERRHIFKETDNQINLKMRSVTDKGLSPILCVGETLSQRNENMTDETLKIQLNEALSGLNSFSNLTIAYEPVWAIGTGLTATEDQIKSAHLRIKEILFGLYPNSDDIPILYGGSVNRNNASALIKVENVSGFLIGGASLKVDEFKSIINNVKDIV